ncbi:MAG: carboxypeptidase regulatory-like domain-containing protein [Bacteroidetes bacterium]|nr:MAG: carboxypeptidase regulatory-like domain-containing protein [Bacteroidota bacterium]
MKQLLLITLVFAFLGSFAQREEFYIQGQVVDAKKNPVADAHVFNERNSSKFVSRSNGIFDVWVLPGDSIIITHISFIRKVVTVHQLMVNPVVQLEIDTINIRSVNVSASQRTDYEKAMTNIQRIEFDFRPSPEDGFTESERMKVLMQSEDEIQRVSASSVSLVRFSPSEEIGKLISKRKKKKEARQFSSSKETEEKE